MHTGVLSLTSHKHTHTCKPSVGVAIALRARGSATELRAEVCLDSHNWCTMEDELLWLAIVTFRPFYLPRPATTSPSRRPPSFRRSSFRRLPHEQPHHPSSDPALRLGPKCCACERSAVRGKNPSVRRAPQTTSAEAKPPRGTPYARHDQHRALSLQFPRQAPPAGLRGRSPQLRDSQIAAAVHSRPSSRPTRRGLCWNGCAVLSHASMSSSACEKRAAWGKMGFGGSRISISDK